MNLVLNIPKDKFNILKIIYQNNLFENKNINVELIIKKNNITITLYKTGKLVIQGNLENELEFEKQFILNNIFTNSKNYILGFDETGRSELIGPFVISGVFGENKNLITLRDSKKTTNIQKAKEEVDKYSLGYCSLVLNPNFIDLLRTNNLSLNDIEQKFILKVYELFKEYNLDFEGIIDGQELNSKKIPLKHIIKADDLVPIVSSASIISKYIRDDSKNKNERKTWNIKLKQ